MTVNIINPDGTNAPITPTQAADVRAGLGVVDLTAAQTAAGAVNPAGVTPGGVLAKADGTSVPGTYIGTFTTTQLAAMNAAIAAGTGPAYASGAKAYNSTTGVMWVLSGLGTAAAFAAPGAGSSALGPYADAIALETAFPAAANAGRFAQVGATAPYTIYASTGTAWVLAVNTSGNGPFGPYASAAALETAFPAAANAGRLGFVGSAAPYTVYTSNGTAWAVGALGPYASTGALQTAFPAAANAGRFATIGASAPYAVYASTGSAWVLAVSTSGNGPFGPYATPAALETAFPAASNPGRHGFVGSAAPYTVYTSNGAAWAIGALGPYTTAAALETAFPSASNMGRFATVGSAAPYKMYSSNGTAWVLAVDVGGNAAAKTLSAGSASSLWVYGHSYTQTPGAYCTAGQEFFNQLKNQGSVAAATTYGIGNSRLINTFQDLLAANLAVASAGSTWSGARRGLAIVDCIVNDIYNPPNNTGGVQGVLLTANQVSNYATTLDACLAILSSAGRVESTIGTTTGTWSTVTAVTYSGGSVMNTGELNAYIDIPVTVPAAGFVNLITYAVGGQTNGDMRISVDGVTYADLPGTNYVATAVYSRREVASMNVMPFAIKIVAAPGARTIRVLKTDNTTNKLFVDCILYPSSTPVPVAVMRDPTFTLGTTSAINFPQANLNITLANQVLIETAIAPIIANYSNAAFIDPAWANATDLSLSEQIHPSDRGMRTMAIALNKWTQTQTAPGMFTTL